ncbi:MAG: rhomboid family intramembrane serine protease [Kiritimatiellia bacterium]
MQAIDDNMHEVAQTAGDKIMEWLAVLAARDIDYHLEQADGLWRILVPAPAEDEARAELAAYEEDELRRAARREPDEREPAGHVSWSPVWVCCCLLFFYMKFGEYHASNAILSRAVADARLILQDGEWWRLVTALTIHGGAPHLLGNMLALLFFGWGVCGLFGGGLGWLLILAAGVAGNFTAAWFQSAHTVSFGASTAGFAALGIMSIRQTVQLSRREGFGGLGRRAWLPLGAGFALLTLLGTGPQSDLTAHLAGYGWGCLLGLPFSLPREVRLAPWLQWLLQVACLLVLLAAWRIVLYAAG